MNTIYIIGFMGVGKTTLTKSYANQMHCSWLDLDQLFEEKMNCSITQWVNQYGMEHFRQIETELLLMPPSVSLIATGGGVVERQINCQFLSQQNVLYLSLPFEDIYQRLIVERQTRPLVLSHTKEELALLYTCRHNKYQALATESLLLTGEIHKDLQAFSQAIEKLKK